MLYLQARVPKPKDRQVSGGFPGPLLRREWLRGALRDINQARMNARPFLEDLFAAAVAAAHPSTCLAPYLPAPPPDGRLIVLAAGKAGGSMIEGAERHYLDESKASPDRLAGLAAPPAGRPPHRARRRQGGRIDDRGGGAPLPQRPQRQPGSSRRARRPPPRLW